MTQRRALLLAGVAHLALAALLSLGLVRSLPPVAAPDVTPVEFVDVGEAPAAPTPAAALPATPVPPPPPRPRREPFDAGAMASLIDRVQPSAPAPSADSSAFAKSVQQAIPRTGRASPRAVATLEQAIRAQIAPCWNPPVGGADVEGMTAVLRIRLNRDGSVAAAPEFVSQTGATAGNAAYARAFVETARRAVLRCAPLQLPADLFSYWREFELNFDPRLMT
jgi:hypothetical protein